MPMLCLTCRHPQRDEIESLIIAGRPFLEIERKYGISNDALSAHSNTCVPAAIATGKEAVTGLRGDTLMVRLRQLNADTREILDAAKRDDKLELALKAIARLEKQAELEARILGQIDESVKVALGVQVQNAPQPPVQDLSMLTEEELELAERLARKIEGGRAVIGI